LKNQGFCVILSPFTPVNWMFDALNRAFSRGSQAPPHPAVPSLTLVNNAHLLGQSGAGLGVFLQINALNRLITAFSQAGINSARYTLEGITARQLSLYESHPT
jgi:hypothetical protein